MMKSVIVAIFLILAYAGNVLADDQIKGANSDTTAPGSTAGAEAENCTGCTGQAAGNPVESNHDPNTGAVNGTNGGTENTGTASTQAPVPATVVPAFGAQSDLTPVPGVIVPGVISDFKPAKLGGTSPPGGLNH